MNASAQELAFASISTVAESVRRKELSPVELVRASLDRVEALDSKLNSLYTLFRDDVLAAARAAEAEIAPDIWYSPYPQPTYDPRRISFATSARSRRASAFCERKLRRQRRRRQYPGENIKCLPRFP